VIKIKYTLLADRGVFRGTL